MGTAVVAIKNALVDEYSMNGGTQSLYRFPNDYGASVVRHRFSYGGEEGLWEIAVIHWKANGEWDIVYDTPITSDVLGWQSFNDVVDVLEDISKLPARVL